MHIPVQWGLSCSDPPNQHVNMSEAYDARRSNLHRALLNTLNEIALILTVR